MENGDGYLRAKKRVENLKAFYIHIGVFIGECHAVCH